MRHHHPQQMLQIAERMRLRNKTQRPQVVGDAPVLLIGRSGVYDDGNVFIRVLALQPGEELPAIHHRHIDIEENKIGLGELIVTKPGEGFRAVGGLVADDDGVHGGERFGEQFPIVGVIVDQ